jgi:probable non-F420 flavinoid oxidoreductase
MALARMGAIAERLYCMALVFSYHASQEQWPPSQLLAMVRHAEEAGFDAAFSSDHLQPWSPSQGESGFTWAWLAAAMQATQRLSFGTITVPCGWRYHPLLLAQAIATLGEMFPGRLPWVALGSGQALNEQPFCGAWPSKDERNRRLREGARLIQALLDGERVDGDEPILVRDARLWSRPAVRPRLVGAARSPQTARWLGGWSEGLLTVGSDLDQLRRCIDAFREGGGEGKPVHVKVDLSWAPTEAEAMHLAHANWRFNAVSPDQGTDLPQPEDYVDASRRMTPEAMRSHVVVSPEPGRHVEHLRRVQALGVDSIDLHQVGGDQRRFIDVFGSVVLPWLRG